MKKIIIWTLGILLGAAMAYVGWNVIMTPEFFMGETNEVSGKVVEVFPSNEVKTFKRKIKYVYSVGDKYYFDFKKLGTNDEKQDIGNEVKIVYSVNNPERNRVKKLYTKNKRYRTQKYYSSKDEGYIEIELNNGVFKYTEFAGRGKIVSDFVGEYLISNDSLKIEHYNTAENDFSLQEPTLFVIDRRNNNQLIEAKTKRVFKRIKNTR